MTLQHLDTVIAFAVIMLGASLLITIFTQAISGFLALRGTNLLWGITTLLATADKRLQGDAGAIAQQVLTHPLLSDSVMSKYSKVPLVGWLIDRWRLGSAIRVDELKNVLSLFANDTPAGQNPAAGAGTSGLTDDQKQKLKSMLATFDVQATQDIRGIAGKLAALAPEQVAECEKMVGEIVAKAQTSLADLENWFNTTMDRVSQRFSTQMRIATIIFSVCLAFFAHMDAFRLYQQLSNDSELRSKLVASADALTQKAGEITSTAEGAPADVYNAAMKGLRQEPLAQGLTGDAPDCKTKQTCEDWLRTSSSTPEAANQLITEYDTLLQKSLPLQMDKLKDQANDIKGIFDQAGLRLFPDPFLPPWNLKNDNVWGILTAAGLLSLGAPFWFNALKTLSNLRPLLSNKTDADQTDGS